MRLASAPKGALGRRASLTVACIAAVVLVLAGCGDRNKNKATQTAAKVNKEEITVHQINYYLGQQRAMPPEQAASSGRQVLERLIDQELVIQKAADQKLDRDPRVVQQVEAARRDVIVKAYVEKIGQGAPAPTPAEVAAYYAAHPALFAQRRIYSLREIVVDAAPAQIEALRARLGSARNLQDFVAYLRDNAFKFAGSEAVRTAEQLPLSEVDRFAALKDGDSVVELRSGGLRVVNVVQSKVQPVSEQQAKPAIEQFLVNERKRKLVADDLHALRNGAKIEYVGQFEADAARTPYQAPTVPDSTPLRTLPPTLPASEVNAAPQVDVNVNRTGADAASMPSGDTLDKGLKGMK
jgi:EpsD family peptidyl-prolyl cis-trans isomerase